MNYEDKLKEYFPDIDFSFLKPEHGEDIMVIECYGKGFEKIKYRGNSEIEAFAAYKRIKHNDKNIIRAKTVVSEIKVGCPKLVLEYNEIERIR